MGGFGSIDWRKTEFKLDLPSPKLITLPRLFKNRRAGSVKNKMKLKYTFQLTYIFFSCSWR